MNNKPIGFQGAGKAKSSARQSNGGHATLSPPYKGDGCITIALDAMGGDHGPQVTVPAALLALAEHPKLKLILVGNEKALKKLLKSHSAVLSDRLVIQHASQEVAMDESPTQALRTKKDSSMRVAINKVKKGEAQACVSAGNTGALMVTARFVLKTLPGIDRPAIITSFPTRIPEKKVWMLDLGANVDSDEHHLYQFAIMGAALVSALKNNLHPRVGLLNIGEEEIKGNEVVKRASHLFSQSHLFEYHGNIEADEIFSGDVDVVVCDGFVGNVALKAMEGTARLIVHFAKQEFQRGFLSKMAALFSLPVLKRLKKSMDPGRYNGANFIGLQGIVIKSHGGANIMAFKQAITEAMLQAESDVPAKIGGKLTELHAIEGTE